MAATKKKWSNKKKAAVAGGVAVTGAALALLLLPRAVKSASANIAPLELEAEAISVLNADQSVTVTVSAIATGGIEPYAFKITWPDGVTDQNGFGTFTRTFSSASVLPPDAVVGVVSSDGQSVSVDG